MVHQADLNSPSKLEVARRERERLKQQEQQKKEQLERLRTEHNMDAADGEVCVAHR